MPDRSPRSRRPARRGVRTRAPRRLPAGERREQLLDVAGAILAGEGYRALTMERLAQRAGVSKGLGYVYFGNVEAVAIALHEREVGALFRRVEEAMRGATGLEERLRRAVRAYLDVVGERGALLGVLQAHLARSRRERRGRRRLRRFLRFWAAEIEGAYGLPAARAEALAGMMLSATDACARSWHAGRMDRAEAERACVAFLREGLRGALAAEAPEP